MNRRIHLMICFIATLLLTGCMGYQLGGSRPAGVETVHMNPIINTTTEPAIELQVTKALRSRMQMDGRLKLKNTAETADAIIDVKLTEYSLSAIAFRGDQKTTAQQYRIRITAESTLTDAETQKIISRSKTYGETTFYFESDLTTSKRDALPRAAEELAKFIADDLIEQW